MAASGSPFDVGGISDDGELTITRRADSRAPTSSDLAFVSRLTMALARVSRFVAAPERRKSMFHNLQRAAAVAFDGDGDLETAKLSLTRIETALIEEEGPALRKAYLLSALAYGLGTSAVGLAVAFLTQTVAPCAAGCGDVDQLLFTAAWIAAGAGIGMLLFSFLRSRTLSYDTLGQFDPDGFSPFLRLAFIGIIAAVFALLLLSGVITIGVGKFQLNNFQSDSRIAFLLGLFCAYGDTQAARIISGVLDRAGAAAAK